MIWRVKNTIVVVDRLCGLCFSKYLKQSITSVCPPERRRQFSGVKKGVEGEGSRGWRWGVEGGKVHALTHASETSVRRRTTDRTWIGVRENPDGKATRATAPAQHRLTTALPGNCTENVTQISEGIWKEAEGAYIRLVGVQISSAVDSYFGANDQKCNDWFLWGCSHKKFTTFNCKTWPPYGPIVGSTESTEYAWRVFWGLWCILCKPMQ